MSYFIASRTQISCARLMVIHNNEQWSDMLIYVLYVQNAQRHNDPGVCHLLAGVLVNEKFDCEF